MAIENRNRWVYTALIVAIAGFVFDRFVLDAYLDERKELRGERDGKVTAVRDARDTLQKEKQMREFLNGPGASLRSEPASVEGEMIHAVQEWEQETNVSNGSFQRLAAVDDHGFTRLTFQISTSGPMRSVAAFLYRMETSSIPLRIDGTQIRPKTDTGEQIQLQLTVSTLCHMNSAKTIGRVASGVIEGDH